MKTISFTAELVTTHVENFTDTYRVYGVSFKAGDPDYDDGEWWEFTRSFEDDDGVCTVRGYQQATLYDKIQELNLTHTQLLCIFEPAGVKETGCARLEIGLNIDKEIFEIIVKMMDIICSGKAFYRRTL